MSQWPFVIAAYAVVFVGTGGLLAWAAAGMRRAERQVEQLRERP